MIAAIQIAVSCLLLFCASAADAGAWRTELGYRFLNSTDELKNTCKHIAGNAGKGGNVYNLSLSLNLQPYRELDNGFQIGAGIGPLVIIAGDARHLQLPVNITLGRAFFRKSPISPYVKAGISYHLSGGDYQTASKPGVYTGIGVRLLNATALKMGMEIACDRARTELYDAIAQKKYILRTGELTLGIFVDF